MYTTNLTINSVEALHYGTYSCNADNVYDRTSRNITLMEGGTSMALVALTLTLECDTLSVVVGIIAQSSSSFGVLICL